MRGILPQSRKLCSVLASNHKDTSTALLSFGNGSQGALGTGGTADEYEPERVQLPKSIAGVGAGHYHSFAITEGGGLWSWGRNNEQQLGRHVSALVDPLPGPVKALEGIRVTACTGSGVASLAATAEGRVFSWGASKRGQLGLGPNHVQSSQPSAIPGLEKIVQVAAGWGHALALDEDGQVFSWGFPQHGRLGHSFASTPAEDEEGAVLQRCVWAPKRVEALSGQRIKQVACGMDFSLAMAESGTVFAFGDNSLGQLGRPPGSRDEASCVAEDWILKDATGSPLLVSKVAAGLGHSLAIDQSGGLISWGWNSAGQLGRGMSQAAAVVHEPSQVSWTGSPGPALDAMHPNPAKLSAGRVHSLVVLPTEDSYSSHQGSAGNTDTSSSEQGPRGGLSELYAWGSGRNGRLGSGCQDNEAYPVLVNVSGAKFYSPEWGGDMILDTACGFDHSLVLVCID